MSNAFTTNYQFRKVAVGMYNFDPEADSSRVAFQAFNKLTEDLDNLLTQLAPLNDPQFTGEPTVPNLSTDDSSGKIANTQFVQDIKALAQTYTDAQVSAAFYPGFTIVHTGATIPDGWLLCDGRAVSRTAYSDLFNELGTLYGSGDGSTTFNLPNKTPSDSIGQVLVKI